MNPRPPLVCDRTTHVWQLLPGLQSLDALPCQCGERTWGDYTHAKEPK